MRQAVDSVSDPVEKVRALVALIFPSPSKNRAFFRAYVDFVASRPGGSLSGRSASGSTRDAGRSIRES
jgi:hypothetical protein